MGSFDFEFYEATRMWVIFVECDALALLNSVLTKVTNSSSIPYSSQLPYHCYSFIMSECISQVILTAVIK